MCRRTDRRKCAVYLEKLNFQKLRADYYYDKLKNIKLSFYGVSWSFYSKPEYIYQQTQISFIVYMNLRVFLTYSHCTLTFYIFC